MVVAILFSKIWYQRFFLAIFDTYKNFKGGGKLGQAYFEYSKAIGT